MRTLICTQVHFIRLLSFVALLGFVCVGEAQPACVPLPANIVSWWQAEGDATDVLGLNNGTFVSPSYLPGEIGSAFNFTGAGNYVQIPASASLNVGAGPGLTIEGWIYPTSSSGGQPVFEWALPGNYGAFFWVHAPSAGYLYADLFDITNNDHIIQTTSPVVSLNTFQHVAVTYDRASGVANLYVNGVIITSSTLGSFIPRTSTNAFIGYRPSSSPFGPVSFNGRIDELSLYSRALTPTEVYNIFNAGTAGKCPPNSPPVISAQPTNQTVYVGQTAVFTVGARGSFPLSYQWSYSGGALSGATNSSLILANVQLAQAGNYSVRVTNVFGATNSSVATLTVLPAGSCAPAPSNLVSWWRGEGNALDLIGGNNGSFTNPIYGPGEVGSAFVFDGSGNNVRIPASASLDVGTGAGFTVEEWVNPAEYLASGRSVFEWALPNAYGVHFWIDQPSAGYLYANVEDTSSNDHIIQTPGPVLTTNVMQHIAVTYDKSSGNAVLYANGTVVQSSALGTFTPRTSSDVYIGYRPSFSPFGPIVFRGSIDEVSLYSRALSAAEIQSIYNAGSGGKCTTFPPYFTQQPSNTNAIVGGTASFSALASGSPPLSYQWQFNGTVLSGQTGTSLVLTNVQLNQVGNYSVQVTNAFGAATSAIAVLAVVTNCTAAPAGLVDWWPAEGNMVDAVGGLNGVLFNGTSFAGGEVGQALSFNGTNNCVTNSMPGLTNIVDSYTMEFWAWPTAGRATTSEGTSGITGNGSQRYAIFPFYGGVGVVGAGVSVGTNGVSIFEHGNAYLASLLVYDTPITNWTHVAVVYTNRQPSLYLNGNFVHTGLLSTRSSCPSTWLGEWGAQSLNYGFYAGRLDEVSVYNRTLSASEINSIYVAGSFGKCQVPPTAPFIRIQPANATAFVRGTTNFYALAGGTPPLSYQWRFNGTNLIGSTNSSLVLSNLQASQAGNYFVTVTNAFGSVTSSNALLALIYPTPVIQILPTNIPSASTAAVPINLIANGNENALGFSLSFDSTKLSYSGISLGTGAAGAVLMTNLSMIGSGKLGVALALSPNSNFAPGTQQVVQVSFAAVVLTNATSSTLAFADQPTLRQLLDNQLNSLNAYYSNAIITIPVSNFEGDLYPRPNGDKNINLADWLLMGRYVARLDYPTNASEFQRADCAPRSTLGDGAIKASDWVQAGRYAFGLDGWNAAGGPTNEISNPGPAPSSTRIVSASVVNLMPGQLVSVSLGLAAQGNENGLSYSLNFDPSVVTFTGWNAGTDASAATIFVNTNQAGAGRLGVAMALSTGNSFPNGTRELIRLNFLAGPGASGSFSPAFTDNPVPREVSDALATGLPVTFANGALPSGAPVLNISTSRTGIILGWPVWASNFLVQQASGPLAVPLNWSNIAGSQGVTNSQNFLTLPLTNSASFYRLFHP